jgi:DNA-binding PadR family transcriptional regulator
MRSAGERTRLLEALGDAGLTGPAISRRVRTAASMDESMLYPALHSLEASWTLRASWETDGDGNRRRTYRRRRFLLGPRRSSETS